MEANIVAMKPVIDDSGEIVRLRQEDPPKHCILKVDSFSLFRDALSDNSLESTEFRAGGYKWVMTVYLNGNEVEQGEGYLSVYVSIVDEANRNDFVGAQLRLFVYDQIRDNYLCVQYVREKRFSAMKSSWGIPQFLSLASFNDASNGFLVDDCCVFGAEVLLLPQGYVRIPTLSIVDLGCNKTFTWEIENFSEQVQELESEIFSFGEWSWTLVLYPKGDGGNGNGLSLFLKLSNSEDLICGNKVFAKCILSIKDQENGEDFVRGTVHDWFTSKESTWGYRRFLESYHLRDSKDCLLVNDTLVVEVRMEVMFALNDDKAKRYEELGDINMFDI